MSFATTAVALPCAVLLPLPLAPSWPYLLLSSALQVGYSFVLVGAYRHGDLGQVYPIARGSVPLLVTVGGLLLTTQRPSPPALLGVGLVAAGLMSLAFGRGAANARSVALALLTGLIIACYVTTDGLGARLSGDPRSYVAWIFLLYGALMPAAFVAVRGRLRIDWRAAEARAALGGGVIALLAYTATVSALALGPLGPVSALRETGAVFALLIGHVFLGEPATPRRILACVAVTAGAVLVGYYA